MEPNAMEFEVEENLRRLSQPRQNLTNHSIGTVFQPNSATAGPSDTNATIIQMMQLMQQQMAHQQELLTTLMQRSTPGLSSESPVETTLDFIARQISEYKYEPEENRTFTAWYARYEELFEKDALHIEDAAKVRVLLRKLSTSEHEHYMNFVLPKHPGDFSFAETVTKLKALFSAKETILSKRYKCLKIVKTQSEDFMSYACRVNRACEDFELKAMTENQLKALVFVCGLKNENDFEYRTRLLNTIEKHAEISLEQLSTECQGIINLHADSAMIEDSENRKVAAIRKWPSANSKFLPKANGNQQRFQNGSQQRFQNGSQQRFQNGSQQHLQNGGGLSGIKPKTPCWYCGMQHWVRDCTFKYHKCKQCGTVGHKEGFCRNRKSPQKTIYSNTHVRVVRVNACCITKRRKYVTVCVNGRSLQLQLDTASDITVIGQQSWRQIGEPQLNRPTVKALTAAGTIFELIGEFSANIIIHGVERFAVIRVAKADVKLLGADVIELFELWSVPMNVFCNNISNNSAKMTIISLQRQFPEVFNGTGVCKKVQVQLKLRDDVTPVFRPKRPVAYAMREVVEKELDRLEQNGVITPINYSDWAAPVVVVRKSNGKIRICGDYSTGLNQALQAHEYPFPIPEEIFTKLAQCNIFTTIDLSDAFAQVPVEEQYRPVLSINTHRGLYQYNRLPPGIKVAPAIFQQLIDTMIAGMVKVCGYMDDLIVGGVTQEEHDTNVKEVLSRIKEYGFTIRADKCVFGMKQIRYLGHIIDGKGIRPDPAKIEAILNLPPPTDISGLRSFIGAINYYGKFVPEMRDLRYPLDSLLKHGEHFQWSKQSEESFQAFKKTLSSDLLLTHYDPKADIIVSADASSVGLGATLSHKFRDGSVKVVQHASRALTETEKKYSQIDREGLAIVFAVTKFHKMIYGRHFKLQTDHRPLLQIFGSKKGIPVYTANRLQRFALTLQLYDFDIDYVRTDHFGDADLLSRLIKKRTQPEEEYIVASIELEKDIRSVAVSSLCTLPLNFRDVANATQTDKLLRKVYQYIQQGWPENNTFGLEFARYYSRKDALSIVDGSILFGERLVIPQSLQKRCLEQFHQGHPGVHRMKALARSYVYWPTLDRDIAECVSTCSSCAAAAKSPPHEVPLPWEKTIVPWQRVHLDNAGPIDGDHFLIVVDAYTKRHEIVKTNSITTAATVAILSVAVRRDCSLFAHSMLSGN
ncbi:uncharacterized protein K02A2.6-like isoform X2 [Anopheles merus]|uniref:uncharacterized protein K02A2.6-like isoform X2 n=1 Tax=Anopheles merus TaxID=30066 RepID=UPI001BE473D9|nr:uncharacterized protein K02A2.6-like isoform X2 [Anopheles merus]